ncbi:CPBP family intramembrane glutamic endopeptidase [Corynebacterium lubricantis]|uniref:CPBP family intramembrane glutamic endopeptidase n=1 Tax=Corynebacterium lubricantis TaxID=541095 RepID=UPI000362971B|nr:CPBP family intramembrane glutamic endopeptidase [Corynebacterium lubricantis]
MTLATARTFPPQSQVFSRIAVKGIPVKDITVVAAVIASLVAVNISAHFTLAGQWFWTIPVSALILLVMAKLAGLTWKDLGISSSSLRKGLRYGGAAALVVTAVVAVGVLLPVTREFFLNETYSNARFALLAALVLIPLQTVLPEELAFRGVLHGALDRLGGARLALIAGSTLFGLWHISSSLGLTASNSGLSSVLGTGIFGQWVGVGLAVVATSAAGAVFTWLRAHTKSVLAPIGLHWSLNAVGALAAAAAWSM